MDEVSYARSLGLDTEGDVCPICGKHCGFNWTGQGAIHKPFKEGESMLVLDKRYYLNADKTKVVEEGSEEAAFLLGPRGFLISEEDAKKLGLKGLQQADQSVLMQRAERGLPNRVNLDVVQHFPKDAEEVAKVKLTDPDRTPLEAVSAQVEARRAEAAEGDESASGDEKDADTEQPRRGGKGR